MQHLEKEDPGVYEGHHHDHIMPDDHFEAGNPNHELDKEEIEISREESENPFDTVDGGINMTLS